MCVTGLGGIQKRSPPINAVKRRCICLGKFWPIVPRRVRRIEGGTYRAAHQRVKKRYGSAKLYPCMNCDDMATEWSYVYDCPNEKVEGVYRLAFCNCANADHYEPLCDTCHRKRDGKVSTTLR